MKRKLQGDYRLHTSSGESFRMYIPHALPPKPALKLESVYDRLELANRALGRLDGVSTLMPDRSLFVYFYIRKEAVLSSQIEGTQSSLSDLLLHESGEAPGVPLDDVTEVSQYVAALEYGLERLREGSPLTLRLMRKIHEMLLGTGRGREKLPGEFRRSPVWIGGSRPGNALFVPPPPEEVLRCMGDLETFIHNQPVHTPTLLKSALAHVQFETIHPFLDGNGRIGRLLITLLLCAEKALTEPLLYLSLYFKTHKQRYYDLLQQVRLEGDWEAWVEFFLDGVIVTSDGASAAARRSLDLFQRDRARIGGVGRVAGSALRVHQALAHRALASIAQLAHQSGLTTPTVAAALRALADLGIVREITGRTKARLFAYSEYMAILNEGADPADPDSH